MTSISNERESSVFTRDFAQWENDIAAFEERDRQQMPPRDATLFIGSSSIGLWQDLQSDFPDVTTINRGFGGSQLSDSVHFAPRIVWPYQPRMIVLYAGDNDLADGATPDRIFDDWQNFVAVVREELPASRIAFIAIKPSPLREALMPLAQQTNELIRQSIEAQNGLQYIDIWTAMLDSDGRPRGELFGEDSLHLNRRGYDLWAGLIAPHLK